MGRGEGRREGGREGRRVIDVRIRFMFIPSISKLRCEI